MRLDRYAALAAGVVACSLGSASMGGDIDPRGVFFHEFSGPFSGREWIHIWDLPGDNRYQFSDILGVAPYDGEILPTGQITWDSLPSQSGTGQFTSQDQANQTLVYQGGTYTSTMRRAPGTDASFITRIHSRENGDAGVAGDWNVTIDRLDAETGALISTEDSTATTTVAGDLLRIEQSDGTFYQGVFETGTTAGFRVIGQFVFGQSYATIEGSETSWTQNLLGDFRMTGDDTFSATMLLSTRRQPSVQEQTVYRITGSRVPAPGAAGMLLAAGALASRRRR